MIVTLNDKEYYQLDITPQTSPRPRLGKFGAYMPAKYKAYQDCMIYEMKKENIVNADYSKLELIAYFPYPKSTPKINSLGVCAFIINLDEATTPFINTRKTIRVIF